MNKKLITGGILLVLALVVVTAYAVPIAPIDKPGNKLSKDQQKRIHENDNPAPLDKNKVPLSGIAVYEIKNKDSLKQTTNKNKNVLPQRGGLGPQPISILGFTFDGSALPHNEESVTTYTNPGNYVTVTGGANDYRGFFSLLSGASGYYVSNDNGTTTLKEGGLPILSSITDDNGASFNAISGGDPALDTFKNDGTTYYSSLYFDPSTGANAVGLAEAKHSDLVDTGLSDQQTWQVGKVRADSISSPQFNDKPWLAVDNSGSTNNIYVSWTAFNSASGTSKIWLASCTPGSPPTCTTIHNDGNPVSDVQTQTQWSTVSVDSAGRVVVTWTEFNFAANPNPPYYKKNIWYRVFAPGGVTPLTAPVLVTTLNKPIDGSFAIQSHFFRVPGNSFSAVANVAGTPRLFVTYSQCGGSYLFDVVGVFADTCSNADSSLKFVDNYQTGAAPSSVIGLEGSPSTHSFFPTLSVNAAAGTLDLAWYQSEVSLKHDIYLATQQRSLSTPSTITQPISTLFVLIPDTDFYLGDFFIGDYIQTKTEPGSPNRNYVHYTANPVFKNPNPISIDGLTLFKLGGNPEVNYLLSRTY